MAAALPSQQMEHTSQTQVVEYFSADETEELAYLDLELFPDFLTDDPKKANRLKSLQLDHNNMTILPRTISSFENLVILDISYNRLRYISPQIVNLKNLRTLNARNNQLYNDSLPKDMGLMQSLQVINLSGNQLQDFPLQLTELKKLQCLQLGANSLSDVPVEIANMQELEVLYLGGNRLTELPEEVGFLKKLTSLFLCDNQLISLPRSMVHLRRLQSLSLHNNQLSTLPPEIVKLNLVELSLRNNPLVVRFVQDMVITPPSLLELAGRVVKNNNIPYGKEDLPSTLVEYLSMAQRCVNPKCKGVYFTTCVEHVKFVDFCGKYRLPLMEYLCTSTCTTSPAYYHSSESDSDEELVPVVSKMRKVLLG